MRCQGYFLKIALGTRLIAKAICRLDKPGWWAQQNVLLQRQYPSPQKRKQKTGSIN